MMCRITYAFSKYFSFVSRKSDAQRIVKVYNRPLTLSSFRVSAISTLITLRPTSRSPVPVGLPTLKHTSPLSLGLWNHLHRIRTCHLHSKSAMSRTDVSLADYDAIGFDIDHTLATYNVPNLFRLLHKAFTTFLVDQKGYHKDLLKPFHNYADFCVRGLVFDVRHGNFLKIATDGTILRASHGTTFLSTDQIASIYKDRHWEPTDKLINHVDNIGNGVFMIFDNFFDMIGTVILARVVDIVDKTAEKPINDYSEMFKDVRDAYEDAYAFGAYAGGTGGFFPSLVENACLYIDRCSEETRTWLRQLRHSGKMLFFMSSSHIDFATFSMKYILGDDWMDYFDLGITRARKPTFFNTNRPFLKLDGFAEKDPVEELKTGEIYSQGNIEELNRFISKVTGKESPRVVYFGDSIRSDISPSRQHAGWDTIFILAELEGELDAEEELNGQPMIKRTKTDETGYPRCGYVPNSPWGSFYTDTLPHNHKAGQAPTDTDHINTLWGHILAKYSTIVIPSIKHITGLPLEHSFKVFDCEKTNQWGFYPGHPRSLNDVSH